MRDFLRSSVARAWVPVLAAAAVMASLDRGTDPGDLVYFVHRGEQLLSGGWANTFANPVLQSGPLQLLLFGAVRNLSMLAFVLELGTAALLLLVLGRLGVGDGLRLAAGLAAVGAGLTHLAFADGHPAEAVVPLLWVLAAVWARDERVVAAGLLIGVSAGFELWGVLGAPVLLLTPRWRRAALGVAVEALVVLAQLAPFALAGRLRMFEYEWRVTSATPLGLLVAHGTQFGWPLRLLQASLAVGAGAVVAAVTKRSIHAVWLVALTVVLLRVLLDPVAFGWYWLEAEVLALVGAALVLRELPSRFPEARLGRAGRMRRWTAGPPPVRS